MACSEVKASWYRALCLQLHWASRCSPGSRDAFCMESLSLLREINDTLPQCQGRTLNFKSFFLSRQSFPVPLIVYHIPSKILWPLDALVPTPPLYSHSNQAQHTGLHMGFLVCHWDRSWGQYCFCLTLISVAQFLSGNRLILRFDLNSNLSPNATTGQELGRGRVAFAEGLGGQPEAL